MIVGALDMLGLVNQDAYTPQTAEQFDTAPSGGDGSSSDRGREDCRRGGQGWSEYGIPDAANGNRATKMNAFLDSAWLAMNPGTEVTAAVRPPGYSWATRYAGHLGLNPRNNINNCHLLGKDLGGSGTDLSNLATCSRAANTLVAGEIGRLVDNMSNHEAKVKNAVNAGQVVRYSVEPVYSGPRTVSMAFRMKADGVNPDGSQGIPVDRTISNSLFSKKFNQWRNIGIVTHQGVAAPMAGTP
ncbi:DNA/RNA non-specific endonuclease [Streptomyces sp. NPDC017520]|uniref:DNA/RNA non-specific endonuclease n=1 Tax=Streptomyces sp. NPDC017520 TaxID=3364998 RepID=UPI0037939FD7